MPLCYRNRSVQCGALVPNRRANRVISSMPHDFKDGRRLPCASARSQAAFHALPRSRRKADSASPNSARSSSLKQPAKSASSTVLFLHTLAELTNPGMVTRLMLSRHRDAPLPYNPSTTRTPSSTARKSAAANCPTSWVRRLLSTART